MGNKFQTKGVKRCAAGFRFNVDKNNRFAGGYSQFFEYLWPHYYTMGDQQLQSGYRFTGWEQKFMIFWGNWEFLGFYNE